MPETAVVTLLFTDLVGSTQLSQRLGEDGAEVLRREHTHALRDAIAATGGNEVKHMGDGLMVVFASPSEAARCAVTMQQSVHRQNRRLPDPLGLRVGLHVGEVTKDGGDYFGTAVVVAERLCKRADGGQTFTSDVLRALVGTRGGHIFKELGPLELKGIDGPVAACELHWEPVTDDTFPLPGLFRSVERLFFVGRSEEYGRLERAWKLAASGERQVAMLSGEPGIGKTRTSTELAFHALDQGAIVLYGRCDEEPGVPYQPFAEALRHYVAHCPVEELREHVAIHGGELARIVPDLIKRVPEAPAPLESDSIDPQADRDAERYRLFDAATNLLRAATERAPLLLVLDDLHWATRPTLLLLRHFLRGSDDWPVLILGTYRDTDLARTHPLAEMLADWRRELAVERITLGGLDESGALAYVEAAAGEKQRPELAALARALHGETEGNPFFMGQVLRHLTETGVVYQKDGQWTYDGTVEQLGIPEGVREVVGRRLSRLSEAANKVLSVAAVVGTDFELGLLERVPDASGEGSDILDALDAAINARVIVELPDAPERYRFTHTLVRQTLYEELSSARRARLHQRVGDAIESLRASDLEPHVPALARHFAEGARAGNVEKAAEYAVHAAQQALTRAAYEEAIQHAERAFQVLDLDEEPHPAFRAKLLLAVAEGRLTLLDPEASSAAAFEAARYAREAGSAEELAQAAVLGGVTAGFMGRLDEGIRLCEEALEMLDEDENPALRSLVLFALSWNQLNSARGQNAEALVDEALALARRSGDVFALAFAASARGWSQRDSISPDVAIALADEVLEAALAANDRLCVAYAYRIRRVPRLALGDRAGFEEDTAEVGRLGVELRNDLLQVIGFAGAISLRMLDGRYAEIEPIMNEYMERFGYTPVLQYSYAMRLISLRWEQGRLAQAQSVCQGVLSAARFQRIVSCVSTALKLGLGDVHGAREQLETLAEDGFASVRGANFWLTSVAFLTEVCADLGDTQRGAQLYDLVPKRSRELITNADGWFFPGAIDRTIGILAGMLGRWDEAEARIREALDFEESVPAPTLAARTRYWYARMLTDRAASGDKERAIDLLDDCIGKAAGFGMAELESKARTLRDQLS